MEKKRVIRTGTLHPKTTEKQEMGSICEMKEEFLAAPELAQRLSLSVHTIRKWKAMKLIPYRQFGRAIRYKQDEVVAAIAKWGQR